MCGIAGIVRLDGAAVDRGVLTAMTDAIAHRGPDDFGYWLDAGVGLGHRRLSIIDLSPAGHQPMSNEDGSIWITYNGEVYNFQDIQPELARAGHRFRSRSDTEVILHSYEQWGPECLSRFNGMFAFGLWDGPRRRLFLARDRFGVKPLFYWTDGRTFCFASEIKALLAHPDVPKRPQLDVACDYLAEGLIDHRTETFFEGIYCLPPSTAMLVSADGTRSWRYFRLDPEFKRRVEDSREPIEEFRSLFSDAVRLRLISDVRVGTNLSGGLDSSCVASMAVAQLRRSGGYLPHITFSACFDDPEFDERPYIDLVARELPLERRECFPEDADLLEQIHALMKCQDQPVMSAAMIAKGDVMALARANSIKVVLEGQGADEYLAGYSDAAAPAVADHLRRGRLGAALRQFSAYRRLQGLTLAQAARSVARYAVPSGLLHEWRGSSNGRAGWLADPNRRRPSVEPVRFASGHLDHWCLEAMFHHFLPFYLRTDDHNAMAHGVEGRQPFLDYRLVQFVLSLPGDYRIQNGISKWILREAMSGIVPEPIRVYPGKRPFPTPDGKWMHGSQRAAVEALLTSRSFASRGIFDPAGAREVFRRFCDGDMRLRPVVWRLVNYEQWLRCFNI